MMGPRNSSKREVTQAEMVLGVPRRNALGIGRDEVEQTYDGLIASNRTTQDVGGVTA